MQIAVCKPFCVDVVVAGHAKVDWFGSDNDGGVSGREIPEA